VRDFPVLELRDELSWLDGTLLAAMRAWVLGCKRGVPADLPIQMIFANLRTPEAIGHLDRFMRALSQGCTRMIEIYCTCEPLLSSDEVLLLDAFAMMQEGMHDAATALLRTFASSEAAHAASGNALAIVQVLNDAGHTIARGPAAVERQARSSDEPFANIAKSKRLH